MKTSKIADIIRSLITCFLLVFLLTFGAFGAWYVGKYAAYLVTTGRFSSGDALAGLLGGALMISVLAGFKLRAARKAAREWAELDTKLNMKK